MRTITKNPAVEIPDLRESDMCDNLIVCIVSHQVVCVIQQIDHINWYGTRMDKEFYPFSYWGFIEPYTGILNFILRSWHYWGDICSLPVVMYVVETYDDIDKIIKTHGIKNSLVLPELTQKLNAVRGIP